MTSAGCVGCCSGGVDVAVGTGMPAWILLSSIRFAEAMSASSHKN